MKASEFLKSRGKPAPSHPVTIRLADTVGDEQQNATASAVMRFLTDREHAAALDAADAALARSKDPPTDESRSARRQAYLLHAVLRDEKAPASPFFDGGEEAHAMLVARERIRLLGEWEIWMEKEFPDALPPEDFKALVEDARALFFGDLLSRHGYWPIRRALDSLAARFGKSQT